LRCGKVEGSGGSCLVGKLGRSSLIAERFACRRHDCDGQKQTTEAIGDAGGADEQ